MSFYSSQLWKNFWVSVIMTNAQGNRDELEASCESPSLPWATLIY